jgi:aldehyde dehydrogenase (NAD+)
MRASVTAAAVELPAGLFIDGELIRSGTAGEQPHVNPATGRVQQTFPLAGTDQVDAAVAAARAAFAGWRAWAPARRRDVLQELARLIRRDAEELVVINALETGTPVSQQRPRLPDIAARFDYYAGWIDKLYGDTIPLSPGKAVDFTLLEPAGVVAKVLTWNTPLGGIGIGVAPALAAGCTVVIKPSELAPFAAVRFGQLCREAGIPDGVVNVVPGGPDAGEALVRHPDVDKISFTGGPAAAALIQRAAADSLTPLVLELGGKSANVVFPDADLDRLCTFAAILTSINGQGCTLPTRLLVHEEIYDEAVGRVVSALATVRVGDPLDDTTGMGPVISEAACARILGMIDRARTGGSGTLLLGGERLGGELAEGYFLPVTVFGDVAPASEIAQSEVFGPVLAITRFATEDEAVALANGTRYGLAAYVHTRDISRALRLASALTAGNIGINGAGAPAGYAAPFGGVKDSGYGREGGRDGIMEFLTTKNVAIALA